LQLSSLRLLSLCLLLTFSLFFILASCVQAQGFLSLISYWHLYMICLTSHLERSTSCCARLDGLEIERHCVLILTTIFFLSRDVAICFFSLGRRFGCTGSCVI
jgi:hypothetical protein